MTTATLPSKKPVLSRKLAWGLTPAHLLLIGIMLLSVVLHFSNLQAIGDANTYYTAAVKSMLQSWHNFFFVAAEPGGSVTVDKPPLGLWVEAAFAFVLGLEGWVVSLPNMLAGILSVPLLYHLVKKHLGELAGLVAALVLVVTPVAIATDRNNTMDGMLVFALLLATWAFITATETGKLRWLLVGGFIIGLGFNIKMLQAFLPLPAFYALYLFGAETGWWKKILHLGLATVVLVVVSLSWAVVVDLTPADRRPYIGSSENNTVMELIVGHNGLSRLFGHSRGKQPPRNDGPPPGGPVSGDNPSGQPFRPPAGPLNGQPPPQGSRPPSGTPPGFNPPPGMLGDGPNASPNFNSNDQPGAASTPFSQETGSPGLARFFIYPLSKQMSWLLPFALISLVLLVFAVRPRLPLEREHKALMLWGGWLLTCLVFFSAVRGIFHAYYAIMLAPALGAVIGEGLALFWRWKAHRQWVNALLVTAAVITIAFQIYTASQYGFRSGWVYLPVVLLTAGLGLLAVERLRSSAFVVILASLVMIPLAWTALTVLDRTSNVNLPTAIDLGTAHQAAPRTGASPKKLPELNEPNPVDEELVAYLQANTQKIEYLVAVPNAHTGSALVLATGRPVLYMGGFTGSDPVIDAAGLAEMVANSELRYVYTSGNRGRQEINTWLTESCTVVPEFSRGGARPNQPQRPDGSGDLPPRPDNGPLTLYRCDG